jgi:hypothetical protein
VSIVTSKLPREASAWDWEVVGTAPEDPAVLIVRPPEPAPKRPPKFKRPRPMMKAPPRRS